jgi:hypothetical protein
VKAWMVLLAADGAGRGSSPPGSIFRLVIDPHGSQTRVGQDDDVTDDWLPGWTDDVNPGHPSGKDAGCLHLSAQKGAYLLDPSRR